MAGEKGACCGPTGGFRVDALVSVDERGQMVLPKELRARVGIEPGDKLAVVSWERDGEICCLSLIKADALSAMLKEVLGPMVNDLTER